MTDEEAIKELEAIKPALDSVFTFSVKKKTEAIDMAIKALKKPAGHWIIRKCEPNIVATSGKEYECSECHFVTAYGRPRFCMECGAEMEGGAE